MVIVNGAGVQPNEVDPCRPVLVPGNIELVDIGVRTQTPELEVHLPGVLTRAGDHMRLVDLTHVGGPAVPVGDKQGAVLGAVLIPQLSRHSNLGINLHTGVVILPLSLSFYITKIICSYRRLA